MKTKFFFFLAMLLMSSVGAFAQSESKTPLKGEVNEDGIVDAADVVEVVNIIMKKDVDPNKYYWWRNGVRHLCALAICGKLPQTLRR